METRSNDQPYCGYNIEDQINVDRSPQTTYEICVRSEKEWEFVKQDLDLYILKLFINKCCSQIDITINVR